jgi:hypothetical protein
VVSSELQQARPLEKVARAISWIGHPLVFVTVSVAIVVITQLASSVALPILATLLFSVIVPTALLLVAGVRSGRWQDADVSVHEERKRFYPWAIAISTLGTLATWVIRAPSFILRGGLVTLGLFVVAGIINSRLKISLHTLFASYCTVILFRIGFGCGVAALFLAVLVFWSRIFLGRHTIAEAVAGCGLGLGGGIIAAWWPS